MSNILLNVIAVWIAVGGALTLFFVVFDGVNENRPFNQTIALGVLLWLFFPLVVSAGVGLGLYKGVPWLASGFSGLYRSFFPKKPELPKVRVV